MTDTNRMEEWRVLCELASKEQNPQKLIDLIMKMNQALEESRRKRTRSSRGKYLFAERLARLSHSARA
jgi:hypothetical protein